MIITRRSFLIGIIAAPLIVHSGIIMPVKAEIIRPEKPKFEVTIFGPDGVGMGPATEAEIKYILKTRPDHKVFACDPGDCISNIRCELDWLGRVKGLPRE